jgi:isocitrate dehydrogenase
VQQFVKENHLRWDSLGEFLALAPSLELLADATDNPKAQVLADALEAATERYLEDSREPSRKVNEPDNRTSHLYVALYWAQALASQDADADLAATFKPFAESLAEAEDTITGELLEVQGEPVDIGGYYYPDRDLIAEAMRPSATFNRILDTL